MSRKFLTPIGVLARATEPASASTGDTYYNTADKLLYTYNGTAWVAANFIATLDGGAPDSTYA